MNLTMNYSFSVHMQMKPTNSNSSYLMILRFDQMPQLNSSTTILDGWSIFCPSNESLYEYFLDNHRTNGHRALIIGLRELNASEAIEYCLSGSTSDRLPRSNQPVHFTSNYYLRFYTSGCFYLDSNQQWQSDGLLVIASLLLFVDAWWSRSRLDLRRIFSKHNASPRIWLALPVVCWSCRSQSIGTTSFPMLISWKTRRSTWRWSLLRPFISFWWSLPDIRTSKIGER